MKKIVLLIDPLNFKPETLDFAAYIAKLCNCGLTGVFVQPAGLNNVPTLKSIGGQIYVEEITVTEQERQKHQEALIASTELFEQGCICREVPVAGYQRKAGSINDIIDETRYADLLIIDPATSLALDKSIPTKFAIDLLRHSECPVLVAPQFFTEIDEVILTYDRSKSSVFAIKQFYYQLPQLASKPITVVHVNESRSSGDQNMEQSLFIEWINARFAKVNFLTLHGNPGDVLLRYFMDNGEPNNKLLVTGAYGRGQLSSFLKESAADLVLKAVDIPIFISHV